MADLVEVSNRALQAVGSRTNVTLAELNSNGTNEAIQINLVINSIRDELIRKAPWNCAKNFANLTFITGAPGTPENSASSLLTWQKGIPAPPWAYEYQYPTDCLRALWVVPQFTTGFSGAVPITTAVTGGVPSFWQGPPIKFNVALDQFFSATAVAVAAGGTGHAAGDVLTLAAPTGGLGAPAQVLVTTVAWGVITAASLVTSIFDEVAAGSYFAIPTNPVAQASSTGVGIGATFNLTFPTPPTKFDQRVILTNQQSPILAYVKRVVNYNVMDDDFVEALVQALGATICPNINGDKALMQLALQKANAKIMEARKNDGNEGLTINDVTPDWIRARGIDGPNWEMTPNAGFDWGPGFSIYG